MADKRQPSVQDEKCLLGENQVGRIELNGVELVTLVIGGKERVCLAQLSNKLLRDHSYNEIHNRRVALGITCVQCTPYQLEQLRRARAMPASSRRCGMITRREAERLLKSFLNEISPPSLPENFVFHVYHECGWGCKGLFIPAHYNSSRAKCIKCVTCAAMFSPNKFIFHCHESRDGKYSHPDAANFNSWRRHIKLSPEESKNVEYAWEDVKAMFNGGSRKRLTSSPGSSHDVTPQPVLERSASLGDCGSRHMPSAAMPFCRQPSVLTGFNSLLRQNSSLLAGSPPSLWAHGPSRNPIGHFLQKTSPLFLPDWNQLPLFNPLHAPLSMPALRSRLDHKEPMSCPENMLQRVSSAYPELSCLPLPGAPSGGRADEQKLNRIKRPWMDSEVRATSEQHTLMRSSHTTTRRMF